MGQVLLGTSGWSYADWVGPFYANAEESKLKAYSRVFRTAEIDSTFYRFPTKGMVLGWLRYTPSHFAFSAKLPKQITHKGKLEAKTVESDLRAFCELLRPLQLEGKVECLLAQLPPGLKFDADLLESFLAVFPRDFHPAVEFRHASWLRAESWKVLEQYNAAYAIVDEPLLPPLVKVTSDRAYVRWHGRGEHPWYYYLYEPDELKPWVAKVEEATRQSEKTLGYFNNHYHGYAVKNCLQFAEMMGELTEAQKEAQKSVEGYFEEAKAAAKEQMRERGITLAAYMPERIEHMDFEELLEVFMDKGRIRRAKGISDEDVRIEKSSRGKVEASIRDYHVVVDVEKREIRHDCPDWSRCAPAKQFCKHVGKIMLTIPRRKALGLMRRVAMEREKWKFEPYLDLADEPA